MKVHVLLNVAFLYTMLTVAHKYFEEPCVTSILRMAPGTSETHFSAYRDSWASAQQPAPTVVGGPACGLPLRPESTSRSTVGFRSLCRYEVRFVLQEGRLGSDIAWADWLFYCRLTVVPGWV